MVLSLTAQSSEKCDRCRSLAVESAAARRGDRPEFVNAPMTKGECDAIRLSIRRNRPYGDESPRQPAAARLGFRSSLR